MNNGKSMVVEIPMNLYIKALTTIKDSIGQLCVQNLEKSEIVSLIDHIPPTNDNAELLDELYKYLEEPK